MTIETGHIAGLDLGQCNDYTALVGFRYRREVPDPVHCVSAAMGTTLVVGPETFAVKAPGPRNYLCGILERWKDTSYTVICERVVALYARPPFRGTQLVVDQTGVGRAVVDMLRKARPKCSLIPITITAGSQIVAEEAGWHVPKKELVGVLKVLFQQGRMKVARSLPLAPALIKEVEDFRVKITLAQNETFEAWREGMHDDMVLACALALWVAEKANKQFWMR